MRISDWSSDVCSSDLDRVVDELAAGASAALAEGSIDRVVVLSQCLGPSVIEDDRPVARRLADAIPGSLLVEEDLTVVRSDERRVGKEGVSTCRSRWSRCQSKKKQHKRTINSHT